MENTFQVLDMFEEYPCDVLAPQETRLTHSGLLSFETKLDHAGFRMLHAPLQQPTSGNMQGGCALVVKKSLPRVSISSYSASDGQAITCQLDRLHVTSVWRRPSATDCTQWIDHLNNVSWQAGFKHVHCLFLGDWNWTSSENFLFSGESFTCAVMENQEYVSSRWQGQRCLDYVISTHDVPLSIADICCRRSVTTKLSLWRSRQTRSKSQTGRSSVVSTSVSHRLLTFLRMDSQNSPDMEP